MKNIARIVETIEQWLIGTGLLVVTFLLFINVVMRYIFKANISWAEEFARYAIVWITFVGAAVCVYKGGHITVDAIFALMGARGIKTLSVIICLISMFFSLALAYLSLSLTLTVMGTGQMSSTLGVPMLYIYGAMPVGSLLMALRYGVQLKQLMTSGGGSDQ